MWPRILFGGERAAAANPDAIVIDCRGCHVHGVGLRRPLTLLQFRFMVAVLTSRGEARRYGELVEFLYGDREDGGPLMADKAVWNLAHGCNRKLGRVLISFGDRRGFRAVLA